MPDETILHEADVREVIRDEIAENDDITPQEEIEGVLTNAVTNASVAHALNSTFSDTEVEAALDALGTAINTNGTKANTNGQKLQDLIDALIDAGVLTAAP